MGHMVLQLIAVTPQPQMFFSTTHMILKIVNEGIELKAESHNRPALRPYAQAGHRRTPPLKSPLPPRGAANSAPGFLASLRVFVCPSCRPQPFFHSASSDLSTFYVVADALDGWEFFDSVVAVSRKCGFPVIDLHRLVSSQPKGVSSTHAMLG
jgi:hypothetical protein